MDLPTKSTKHLKIKLLTPNPIFIKWIERWLVDAKTRDAFCQIKLSRALKALRRYPLPLNRGCDCAVLRGFGPSLCKLIDKELLLQSTALKSQQPTSSSALNNNNYQSDMQLVVERVNEIALKAKLKSEKKSLNAKFVNKCRKMQSPFDYKEESISHATMSPGTFEIFLLVDTQETNGKNKCLLNKTRSSLQTLAIPHEVRRLTVGDFMWIARDRVGNELVLPYIVERKRMDDLSSSIRDGRFHEQKHRLKQCGLQYIIYLIEDHDDNENLGIQLENLMQALANTQVQNDFSIVPAENHYRCMLYLQCMTRTLIQMYKTKVLIDTPKELLQQSQPADAMIGLLNFQALYKDSARGSQLSLREVFLQQLLQLHSLSTDRALCLVGHYSTPRHLLDMYDVCTSENEASTLIAQITCGQLQRPIGNKISRCIYKLYRTNLS